jgi:SAM-dependent methyltransferase
MNSPEDLVLRQVADIYDEPWTAWTLRTAGTHLHPGREVATVNLIEKAAHFGFPAGGLVLEVASALGGPARVVARHFSATMICVDMNPMMQRALRATAWQEGIGLRCQGVIARTERLPIRDASLDGAWSQDAMCHMDKPAVVAEVARVLKPGGTFAFTDWIARTALSHEDWEAVAREWGFPSLFALPDYVAALAAKGFDLLLAEDRSSALAGHRAPAPADQQAFEQAYADRWGEAELARQKAPGEVWQALAVQGKTGVGMFIARKR